MGKVWLVALLIDITHTMIGWWFVGIINSDSGLYAGSNYCQSHVLVCQSHVLVDTLMLTVKLVYKLSNCA